MVRREIRDDMMTYTYNIEPGNIWEITNYIASVTVFALSEDGICSHMLGTPPRKT